MSLDGTAQRTIDLFSPHGGSILISDIIIGEKRRDVKPEYVKKLADSIKQVGLINPITVAPDNHLIAGYHRLRGEAPPMIHRSLSRLVITGRVADRSGRLEITRAGLQSIYREVR